VTRISLSINLERVENTAYQIIREAKARAEAKSRHHVTHEAAAAGCIRLPEPAARLNIILLGCLRYRADLTLERVDVLRHLIDEHLGRLILLLHGERGLTQIQHELACEVRIRDLGLQLVGQRLDDLCHLIGLTLRLYDLIFGSLIVHLRFSPG
jgi:hypothetical protein